MSPTFIQEYKVVDKIVKNYFENYINTFVDNKHSFNQLKYWYINNNDKVVIVYKNYFMGDITEIETDIL